MTWNRRLGRAGEAAAARYLETLGYRIVARNHRGPSGEIDIVAVEGAMLVFVEVKARSTAAFGSALGAVDAQKRRRLRAAAEDFLQFHAPHMKARFDVLAIDGSRMRLYRAAFS